jgi:tRNA nucleotidyltransferase (CCA-adding enzyme)
MTIRLFEVGGSIRDELMGIADPHDRDFCAVAPSWEALLEWCHTNMERVFLVTPEFFTVRGRMPSGVAIDVVMCRKDGPSTDGRHPDHVEPGSLLSDLTRRDFTINAMAREVDPKTLEPAGKVIDPFHGALDLKRKKLRCVGTTDIRLSEDGLRLLRAVRFAITKDLDLHHALREAIADPTWWEFMSKTVSVERIREEVQKMMVHDTVATMKFLTSSVPAAAVSILFKDIWLKPTLEKK